MNISLIQSPFSLEMQFHGKKEWDKVVPRIHPLGLGYIASYLKKYGHSVDIIDAHSEKLNVEQILNRIELRSADVIGLSTTTPTYRVTTKIAEKIKHRFPHIPIVIGGAHVTADPENAILNPYIDYGVIGEGEYSFHELIDWLKNKTTQFPDHIPGLIYKSGSIPVKTKLREMITNLDSLPFPARDLMIPLKDTQPVPASVYKLPSGNLITSRGCPSMCTFCDRAIFGTKFRARSAVNVVDEIQEMIEVYGAQDIKFYDDTFTASKKRTYEIIDEMKKRKIKVPWSCLTRVKSVDKDLIKYMKDNGCWQILYGLESGDARMLKLLKKGNTIEDNKKAVLWAAEAGLSIRADFVVGTPGETVESLYNTLNHALSLPIDYAHFNKFVPFPGTEIYMNLLSQGYHFDEKMLEGSSVDFFDIDFVPEGLDKEIYKKFLIDSHRRFYFRLPLMLKHLTSIKTADQFKVKLNGFFALLHI